MGVLGGSRARVSARTREPPAGDAARAQVARGHVVHPAFDVALGDHRDIVIHFTAGASAP
jgi:hypothetical protein